MIEKEILGCFLKDNALIRETKLKVPYFKTQANQLLFQSMLVLDSQNKPIDKVTLMTNNYEYIKEFGVGVINELEAVGRIENFETYEYELIEQYKKRKSKEIASSFIKNDEVDIINELQQLQELNASTEVSKDDVLTSMIDLPFQDVKESEINAGLSKLDSITGGFIGGSSYIVGARPSMGKTAFALKIMKSAFDNDFIPVMYSLEMPTNQLLKRLIATIGEINLFFTRDPFQMAQSKKQAWQRAVKELQTKQFEIFDKTAQTLNDVRANLRKTMRKYPNKKHVVIIDYLTLINDNKTYQSEHLKISAISKGLKNIARDYNVPVITLAQLSRSIENRQDKRPMLSDLRESGSIEEDADVVMFLYRDSYYNKENENDTLEINVAKNRNGATGTATVYYKKETGRMGDLDATFGNVHNGD